MWKSRSRDNGSVHRRSMSSVNFTHTSFKADDGDGDGRGRDFTAQDRRRRARSMSPLRSTGAWLDESNEIDVTDPPFKKRKIKSVLDCTMEDNEIIGSNGIKKTEFVRLLIESLSSLGYKDIKVSLEKESGVRLCSSVVSEFIDMILDGNWDQSLNLLRKISNMDECDVKMASFVILEHKFLEFLDGSKVGEDLSVLTVKE